MDPQAPIEIPKAEGTEQSRGTENPERVVSEIEPRVERDNHWISILAMAIFILFALGVVAFLYYQNQQLKSMLASYQTPVASPTPSATVDPTANWKIYTDPKGKYSFKYPADWTTSKDVGIFNDPSMKFILDIQTEITTLNVQDWTKANICTKLATTDDPNGCTVYIKGPIENSIQTTFLAHYGGMHTVFKYGDTVFDVSLAAREPNPNFEEIKGIYNQILSTFQFTGPSGASAKEDKFTGSPTPVAKACTQEAKICPDGSSVGRTGPNCEFAACP